MIKIGLCGLGHLGMMHLKCLMQTKFDVIGLHDIDHSKGRDIAAHHNIKYYTDIDELIDECDAIDIVTSTASHSDLASKCMEKSKSVFIEKPVTQNGEEADQLIRIYNACNSMVQVGHIERYNPAYRSIVEYIKEPKFVETHRLAPMHLRGNDVSVVKDLMIHDLDLVLHWLPYEIADLRATGVSLINDSPDICNVRIEFVQGSVCNITASRVSDKKMRKSRLFQEDGYISIDFLNSQSQFIRFSRKPEDEFQIIKPHVASTNALLCELQDFYDCIVRNKEPENNLENAVKAIKLADQIEEIVNKVDYIKATENQL